MRKLCIALLVLCIAIPAFAAAPDYERLYREALEDSMAWQEQAFALSAEIGRVKALAEDALKLYEEAERDGDLLRVEIDRLTRELETRDAIIDMQAAQIRKFMGTERFTWLIAGILGGALTGFVVGK